MLRSLLTFVLTIGISLPGFIQFENELRKFLFKINVCLKYRFNESTGQTNHTCNHCFRKKKKEPTFCLTFQQQLCLVINKLNTLACPDKMDLWQSNGFLMCFRLIFIYFEVSFCLSEACMPNKYIRPEGVHVSTCFSSTGTP